MTRKVVYLSTHTPQRKRKIIEQILEEHGQSLQRFLRARLALEPDREDVCQDVFLRLSALDGLEQKLSGGAKNTRSYLFSIANNLIRDRQRRAQVRRAEQHESFDEDTDYKMSPNPEDFAIARQGLERMSKAFSSLGPKCKYIFMLSRFQHKSYQEIANEEGVTVSMVEKHISKALIALRGSMAEVSGVSEKANQKKDNGHEQR